MKTIYTFGDYTDGIFYRTSLSKRHTRIICLLNQNDCRSTNIGGHYEFN